MRHRELILAGATLFIGAALSGALGAWVTPSAVTTAACLYTVVTAMMGLGLLIIYVAVGRREEAFHQSQALDLVFEGEGTPCVYHFAAPQTRSFSSPLSTAVIGMEPVFATQQATIVRLHVKNLRARRLSRVRVRVQDVRRVSDGQRAHPHSDWLKWMHDDSPSHPQSVEGREIEVDDDPHAYIDLATKVHNCNIFFLDFAMPHLRQVPVSAAPYHVQVVASGCDEVTGRTAPKCQKTFILAVDSDGTLTVSSKSIDEDH